MTATIDRESVKRLERALKAFPPKMQKSIAKDALRPWAQAVRKAARGFAWKNAERTKKQLFYKVKTYKRAVWAAVGVRAETVKTPKESRLGRYSPFVGWKSHFMEVGWHAWPKGRSGNAERVNQIIRNKAIDEGRGKIIRYKRTLNGRVIVQATRERKRTVSEGGSRGGGRGWKRGLRGFKGVYQSQYARHYLYKAAMVGRQMIGRLMNSALHNAVRETGKAA